MGSLVGIKEGSPVGLCVSAGECDGLNVGAVGDGVGSYVGFVGCSVGSKEGSVVGSCVGASVGCVGTIVGLCVASGERVGCVFEQEGGNWEFLE